jgi:uncharacterized protein YndB with AHSA1/START domain
MMKAFLIKLDLRIKNKIMTTQITISAHVNAPVEKVWECWTQPRHIIRWNNASEDWCTLKATNDLQPGGKFSSTMAAKDGSFSFDFEGVYDTVKHHELIQYTMTDGRKATIHFTAKENATTVDVTFDAENENPVDMQQQGWQSILNNFKKHTEGDRPFEVIHFSVTINAPVEKVAALMLADETYRQWTAEFNPGSHFEGSWQKGAAIQFVGVNDKGEKEGMASRIREHVPNEFVSIEHLGLVLGDKQITTGPEVESWAGALENYTFKQQNGNTLLEADMDANAQFKSYFETAWPAALKKLKEICEQ